MKNKNYLSPKRVAKNLIKEKKWKELKKAILSWHPLDIVDLFKEIGLKNSTMILRILPKDLQSEVFSELDRYLQEKILRNLADDYIKSIITNLDPDDRTELLEEMSPALTRKLINLLPPEERKEALWLLGYPPNSVGRLMNPDYVAIKPHWSVEKSMKHIQRFGKDAETIDIVYVVDKEWHLIDEIPIRRLILAKPRQLIRSLMDYNVVSINANQDQEEAIKLSKKYGLISLPVVDSQDHLLGIVTVDDIMNVIQEEQTEDVMGFSAIEAESVGLDFITKIKDLPFRKIFRARITWLFVLLVMDIITGNIIQGFRDVIAKYVVLVTFLPVLIDTAGNAGSQSATLVIRALALGTIKMKDWAYLLFKELVIATLLGITMGIGISVMGIIRGKNLLVAGVVVISMIINVIVGSIIGILLPFIFTKFRKDPATASGPLITTLADIIGTGIYLTTAYFILF